MGRSFAKPPSKRSGSRISSHSPSRGPGSLEGHAEGIFLSQCDLLYTAASPCSPPCRGCMRKPNFFDGTAWIFFFSDSFMHVLIFGVRVAARAFPLVLVFSRGWCFGFFFFFVLGGGLLLLLLERAALLMGFFEPSVLCSHHEWILCAVESMLDLLACFCLLSLAAMTVASRQNSFGAFSIIVVSPPPTWGCLESPAHYPDACP